MNKTWLWLFCLTSLCAEQEEVGKISEAMGHVIGKNLQALGLPLDLEALIKGLQDEAVGKASPLGSDEYDQAIVALQEENHEKIASQNLEEANTFLKKNQKEKGVITRGKLQYKVLQEGTGPAVEAYNTPLIRYQGRALNGEILQSDFEEELLCLDEALFGLKEGIVGMKEGEKRILYIHPDLGYGKESFIPNSLLIFEVEVVKASPLSEERAHESES